MMQKKIDSFNSKPEATAEHIVRIRDGRTGKFIRFAKESEILT